MSQSAPSRDLVSVLEPNATINVADVVYRVCLTWRPLYGLDGRRTDALAQESTETIWIAADIAPHKRWARFVHELSHVCDFVFGEPAGCEDRARRTELMDWLTNRFEDQISGRLSMATWQAVDSPRLYRWRKEMQVQPPPSDEPVRELKIVTDEGPPMEAVEPAPREPVESEPSYRPDKVPCRMLDMRYCPECMRPVTLNQIVDHRIEHPHWGPVLHREIYCACRPAVFGWLEPAGPGWKPAPETGSLEPTPRIETDPEKVKAWRETHKEAVADFSDGPV
jgi:hypothetical protein